MRCHYYDGEPLNVYQCPADRSPWYFGHLENLEECDG